MADTMDKLFKKKRMICTMCRSKIGQAIIRLAVAVWVTAAVYIWLAPLAYLERGYQAYGGECLAAAVAGMATYYVIGRRFIKLKKYKVFLTRSCEVARLLANAHQGSGEVLSVSHGFANGKEFVPAMYYGQDYFYCCVIYSSKYADYELIL